MRNFGKDFGRVSHPNGDGVQAGLRGSGDVELKGQVAAFVFAHTPAVDPHFCQVIHRAKAEQDDALWLQPINRDVKLPLVADRSAVIAVARVGLPGSGDSNQ